MYEPIKLPGVVWYGTWLFSGVGFCNLRLERISVAPNAAEVPHLMPSHRNALSLEEETICVAGPTGMDAPDCRILLHIDPHAVAQSCDNNAACSNTVCVAFSCLSGG